MTGLGFFFSPAGWGPTKFPSSHRGIFTASSCTSLHFTAVGSLDGPAAPIASLLMDLRTVLGARCSVLPVSSCIWCAPTFPNGLWITVLPADFWCCEQWSQWEHEMGTMESIDKNKSTCMAICTLFVTVLPLVYCLLITKRGNEGSKVAQISNYSTVNLLFNPAFLYWRFTQSWTRSQLDKRMDQQKQGAVDNYPVKAFLFARDYDSVLISLIR